MKNNTKNIRKGITAILFAAIILLGALPVISASTQICIDIKPGSFPNSINTKSNGVIPVAIWGTCCPHDALVNPTTIKFGPSEVSPVHHAFEDLNGDGCIDLILHFRTKKTGIALGDTFATLTGSTYGGCSIWGTDSVRVVH